MATIQTIQIYSGAGQLLEQLEDVNTWTAMYMHYTKTQGLTNHQKISTTKTNYTKNYTNYLQLQMYIHIPGLIQTYRKKNYTRVNIQNVYTDTNTMFTKTKNLYSILQMYCFIFNFFWKQIYIYFLFT